MRLKEPKKHNILEQKQAYGLLYHDFELMPFLLKQKESPLMSVLTWKQVVKTPLLIT